MQTTQIQNTSHWNLSKTLLWSLLPMELLDQQSPAKRQQQFNVPGNHYWNDHRLRTGVTNATSIPVSAWGTKILHNTSSECNYATSLITDKSCLSGEGMLLDIGKSGTEKNAISIPIFGCYRVRTLSSWQDSKLFFIVLSPYKRHTICVARQYLYSYIFASLLL